jgi:hypothetical protein
LLPSSSPPPVMGHPHSSGAGFGLATVGTRRYRSGWHSCKPALCLPPPPALDVLVAFRRYMKRGRRIRGITLGPQKLILLSITACHYKTATSRLNNSKLVFIAISDVLGAESRRWQQPKEDQTSLRHRGDSKGITRRHGLKRGTRVPLKTGDDCLGETARKKPGFVRLLDAPEIKVITRRRPRCRGLRTSDPPRGTGVRTPRARRGPLGL